MWHHMGVLHRTHTLRTRGQHLDFEEIIEVCPWTIFAHELNIPLDGPQVGAPRIYKSHEDYKMVPKGGKYIYVVRNPQDACVSFYHFLISFVGLSEDDVPIDEFIQKLFLNSESPSGTIFHHYLSFYEQRKSENILFVFYEDLLANLEVVIEKIALFMNIDLDADLRAITLEHTSFAFMRARSTQFDEHLMFDKCKGRMGLAPDVQTRTEKVNKGKRGAGDSELTPEHHRQLEAAWQEVFGATTGVKSYQQLWEELSPLAPSAACHT